MPLLLANFIHARVCKPKCEKFLTRPVEETLNERLEAAVEKLTQAARYERNEQRQGYRSGHYNRNLTTTSGHLTLKMPKLKGISFETADNLALRFHKQTKSSVHNHPAT